MLDLEKFKGLLVGRMFPTDKEVELAIKKLDMEDGPYAKYLLKSKGGIEQFLKTVEKKIQELEKYSHTYSFVDLFLGEGTGGSGKAVMQFDKLIEKVNEASAALKEMEESRLNGDFNLGAFNRFNDIIDEITKGGLTELDKLTEMSTKKAMGWFSSFFSWRYQKGEEVVRAQIESNNKELAAFLATREEELRALEEQAETEGLTIDERTALYLEMEEIKREEIEKTAETERLNSEITLETIRQVEEAKKNILSSTMEALGNTGDFLMNWSDNIVKKETKNGQKMSKEKEKQAKAMFEVGKALAISEAVVSTYQGAQGAFTSLASIPYVGPALGIAAAAAAITAGMLRVQSIASQKFGDTANISDGGSSIQTASAVAVPQLEGENPYGYTRNLTTAEEEDKLNQPVIVQVSDIDDALKVRESRVAETSF